MRQEEGDVLRHDRYDTLRNRMTRIAADRGYFDADLHTRRLEVDREHRTATIRLHMDTGDRYRMGRVTLDQDILAPEFVERMIPFEEGDPYSSSQIIALQRNLNDSGYFSGVRVRPLRDQAEDRHVPIVAEFEPAGGTATRPASATPPISARACAFVSRTAMPTSAVTAITRSWRPPRYAPVWASTMRSRCVTRCASS